MSQHSFQFFSNLMTFFSKKFIKYSFFVFIFNICANFQTKRKTHHDKKFNVFTLSHFEKLHDFLHMVSAIIIFGESNFIFNFVGYGLVTKSLGAGCTFEEVT